jgi:hypothetical protein
MQWRYHWNYVCVREIRRSGAREIFPECLDLRCNYAFYIRKNGRPNCITR